jgi:hypothetical protein
MSSDMLLEKIIESDPISPGDIYDCQVMKKEVADFWLSKLELPVTMAESSSLTTIKSESIPE